MRVAIDYEPNNTAVTAMFYGDTTAATDVHLSQLYISLTEEDIIRERWRRWQWSERDNAPEPEPPR